jgi:hypothetical protein
MKLLPEEFDLLIAEHRNNGAYARGEGRDGNYADFCEKRATQLLKAKERQAVKNKEQAKPRKVRP